MRILSFGLALIACLLSACAPFHYSDHRAAYCNELNSKIIFNGSTSSHRQADIQNAGQPLAVRDYEACMKNEKRHS